MNWLGRLRARHGVTAAFIFLAIASGVALDRQAKNDAVKLWHAQVTSCHRENQLRKESNGRIGSHRLDSEILARFLRSAAKARAAGPTTLDRHTAVEYNHLADQLNKVRFNPVPLTNCSKAIPKP